MHVLFIIKEQQHAIQMENRSLDAQARAYQRIAKAREKLGEIKAREKLGEIKEKFEERKVKVSVQTDVKQKKPD